MRPTHVPPQYSFRLHGAVVDPSLLANLSVMTWYIDCERHCAGVRQCTRAMNVNTVARRPRPDVIVVGDSERQGLECTGSPPFK